MVARTFYAVDSDALSVTFLATRGVGDSIINNSDSPDGTTYVFGVGHAGNQITVDDTGGYSTTLEDDDQCNDNVTDSCKLFTPNCPNYFTFGLELPASTVATHSFCPTMKRYF